MPPDDHLDGRDVDAEFAAIVAGWDDVPDLPATLTGPGLDPSLHPSLDLEPGPETASAGPSKVPPPPTPVVEPGAEPPRETPPREMPPRETPPRETPPPGIVEAGLEEGHFEPPPVELPPQEDLHFWGIVVGLTLGPILLIWMALFGSGHSVWWTYAAIAMSVGGFVLLVLRLPKDHDDDDRDSGARV